MEETSTFQSISLNTNQQQQQIHLYPILLHMSQTHSKGQTLLPPILPSSCSFASSFLGAGLLPSVQCDMILSFSLARRENESYPCGWFGVLIFIVIITVIAFVFPQDFLSEVRDKGAMKELQACTCRWRPGFSGTHSVTLRRSQPWLGSVRSYPLSPSLFSELFGEQMTLG